MEEKKDIRWVQRYNSFHKAVNRVFEVLQKAFEDGLIVNHDGWRKMMKARNTTSHIYNEGEALSVVECIYRDYSPLLDALDKQLEQEVLNAQVNNLFDL